MSKTQLARKEEEKKEGKERRKQKEAEERSTGLFEVVDIFIGDHDISLLPFALRIELEERG